MKHHFFFILSLLFITSSCTEVNKKIKQKKEEEYKSFLFNMTHTFSANEKNMSFPNWFDEDIIRDKNIKSILRTIYPSGHEDNPEEINPKETKKYQFDTDGSLKSVTIKQFYEHITVADLKFDYKKLKDEHGFSPVQLIFEKNENNIEAVDQFNIFDKVEYHKSYLVYQNTKSGDYRFYMLKKEYWGTLSVDSIFDPTPQDAIIFGSPLFPQKEYFVENKVNESNVLHYRYSKNKTPIKIIKEDFPFYYKRTIMYDKEGSCTGFIDSTFSNNEFLYRKNSSFVFHDKLPVKLIHENSNGNRIFIKIETFEYEFFR